MSESGHAYSGPVGVSFDASEGTHESLHAYSGPLLVPASISGDHESGEAYSGPLFIPIILGTVHESDYAYSGATVNFAVPTVPSEFGELPTIFKPLVVVNVFRPKSGHYVVNRLPDVAVEGAFIDYHWMKIRHQGDDEAPEIVNPEATRLELVRLPPGRFRYRFFTRLATGETAVQDFLLQVRGERADRV